jgi:hypothetical protein
MQYEHKRAGEQHERVLISQALLFLLRNKDRYGVWYSSQATVNARRFDKPLGNDGQLHRWWLCGNLVNRKSAGSLSLPNGAEAANPITVNAEFCCDNRIKLSQPAAPKLRSSTWTHRVTHSSAANPTVIPSRQALSAWPFVS